MSTKQETSSSTRTWTLVLSCICAFMLILDLSVVAVALPSMQVSLNASLSELQWVFDAYAVTLAALLVTAGSIADKYGRKFVFVFGLAVFTAGSLMCGIANSALLLDLSRAAQGVGAAVLYAVGPALLSQEFRGKARANAFAAYGAATGIAAAAGPLIGGSLTSGPGWRWIFLMNVPIGLAMIPLALTKLKESKAIGEARQDIAGMVSLTALLGSLVLAITRGNPDGWFSATNDLMYLIAFGSLVVLVTTTRSRQERALFEPAMFKNATFSGLCVATLLVNMCGFPFIFLTTSYLQSILGSSPWQAGIRLLPLTVTMLVLGAVTGELCKRVPFRVLLFVACSCVGGGAFLTLMSDSTDDWTSLIPALVIVGIGFGIVMPVRAALSVSVLEPAKAGLASGISETFQQAGIALGLAIGGAYFENRVIHDFAKSTSGQALGADATSAGRAVSAGAINAVSQTAPALSSQIVSDARAAFTTGFHDAMTLGVAFAAAGALVAVVLVSNRHLHPNARLDGIPPELEENGSDLAEGDPYISASI